MTAGPRAAILGVAGPRLTAAERRFLTDADPWGFILFARNVETPDQTRALTAELRAAVGRAAPILIDQEGGRVARLRAPHWREWTDLRAMVEGLSPDRAEAAVALRYRLIAHELRAVGIDVNCAPVLDLPQPGGHPFLQARAMGADPAAVARYGHAVRAGLRAGGVSAVIKHMPGHGRADGDSHLSLPRVTVDRATLDATDFAVFRAHADAAMGMTAHVLYAAIDPQACGTFSPEVIRVIRRDIGFGGLLMTDDIGMGALDGPHGARAARALAAGVDVVLHCSGALAEMAEVIAATPRLTGAALARADAAARAPTAEPFDVAEADRSFRALVGADA